MPPVKRAPHTRSPTFLREWREYRDLSQQEAAERIEVDYTTLGRIERGVLPYNQDFMERAALAYGCEPFELLSLNPLNPPKPKPPELIWDRLKEANESIQAQAIAIIEALLKAS